MNEGYQNLAQVLEDDLFPEVDLSLRRGSHIDRDEADRYAFLCDAQSILESFYHRYGCELVHACDGYFYLLPLTDAMGRHHLSAGEMLVGQTLALLYLDPATLQAGGITTQDTVVSRLAGLISTKDLVHCLNPRRRRVDDRMAEEAVRVEIAKAIRGLVGLGFVDMLDEGRLRLRLPVFRFADGVRGLSDPAQAMAMLVAQGKAVTEETGQSQNEDESVQDDDLDTGDDVQEGE